MGAKRGRRESEKTDALVQGKVEIGTEVVAVEVGSYGWTEVKGRQTNHLAALGKRWTFRKVQC